MKVVLSPNLTSERLKQLAQIWNEEVFARVEFSGEFSEADLEQLVLLAIALKPNDFADVVLETIAGMASAPPEVLRSILKYGDDSACEAVCEREDLDDNLRKRCARRG